MAALLLWQSLEHRASRIEFARAGLLQQARLLALQPQNLVARTDALLNSLMAPSVQSQARDAETCSSLMAERLQVEKIFLQIGKVDAEGNLVCAARPANRPINYADRAWFATTLASRELVISDIIIGKILGKPLITLSKAARDAEGKVRAVYYLSLPLDWLKDELSRHSGLPDYMRIVVFDGQGHLVTRIPENGVKPGDNVSEHPVVQRILAERNTGILVGPGLEGGDKLIAYAPLLATGSGQQYYLWLSADISEIEAPAQEQLYKSLGISFSVLLLLFGLVAWKGCRDFIQPLHKLLGAIQRFGRGDMDVRSGLPHTGDEIGQLARILDETADTLQQQTKALTTANADLESVSFAVSHDLRGPLGRIANFSRLLEERYKHSLDQEGLRMVEFIRQNAFRLNHLVDDLVSHAAVSRQNVDLQPVDLSALVSQVLAGKSQEIEAAGASVEAAVGQVAVLGSPVILSQALDNLIQNALKYSFPEQAPRIEIGSSVGEGKVLLWVRDHGIGFDMAYHDQIFEMFKRLHAYNEYKGSGIGLALVRRAMERVGGRVWAESLPGAGSTFFLEFRQAETPIPTEPAAAPVLPG